jgi:hypothetical protein
VLGIVLDQLLLGRLGVNFKARIAYRSAFVPSINQSKELDQGLAYVTWLARFLL